MGEGVDHITREATATSEVLTEDKGKVEEVQGEYQFSPESAVVIDVTFLP